MKFIETLLKGAFIIELEKKEDKRGFFARSWCEKEFKEHGLNSKLVQCSISFNKQKGTVRGMHYQKKPYEEEKIVSCIKGAVYDVIVDLRKDSPSYSKWIFEELTAENHKMLYIPKGFAHGFQTLEDNTEVHYQMSVFFNPGAVLGIKWNDPEFNIGWPIKKNIIISERDQSLPAFKRDS